MNPFLIFFSLLVLSLNTQATESVEDIEILARRGKGVVTQETFTARAEKIPANIRQGTLRSGGRLREVINTLLIRSQLAADARDAGYDKDQMVTARMQLAAEAELAEAWVQHYVDIQPKADYEQLAREYYELNKDKILSSPKIDVSHILVSSEDRSQEEALELADTIALQLEQEPEEFDDLVLQYSEDPSVSSNKGKFTKVKKGDMVPAFEEVAFALQPGEISGPVETEYGYHIIRLDKLIEPEQMSFESVRQRLIEREIKKHDERIKQDYVGGLTALELEMSEESLQEMVRRLFGEDYVDPHTAGTD